MPIQGSNVAQLMQRFQRSMTNSHGLLPKPTAAFNPPTAAFNPPTAAFNPPTVSVYRLVQRFQTPQIDVQVPAQLYNWRGDTLDFNRQRTIFAAPGAHCQEGVDVPEMPRRS